MAETRTGTARTAVATGDTSGDTPAPPGRRERKKAATRLALADAALRLFLAHGYDQVSVKDVAEAADVSTTTLFKHFPGKEALVFDRDSEMEDVLVATVRDRAPGQSVLAALRARIVRIVTPGPDEDAGYDVFLDLVERTPALREYGQRMWMRHETALARAIAEESGAPADDLLSAALARFALQTQGLGRGRERAALGVDAAFDLLEHGWAAAREESSGGAGAA